MRAVICCLFVAANAVAQARAQIQPTRLTVVGAPMLSQPKGSFGSNIGNTFGGGGGLLYNLDRSGFFSVRFDASGLVYGHETKQVPFSETVGGRVLVDVRTANSIAAVSIGPEIALPKGPIRPYLNTAFTGLFFNTSSSVDDIDGADGEIVSTTNHSDRTRAWTLGGGFIVPFTVRRTELGVDFGLRYHRGGEASYLREGSIQDNPNGSISFVPLQSRTPYMVYMIGVRFRIPYDSPSPCPRFLC